MTTVHKSVLLHEAIDGLGIQPGDVYLDGTLGGGGHAEYVVQVAAKFNCPKVTIVGLDEDEDALARAKIRLEAAVGKIGQLKDEDSDSDGDGRGMRLFFIKENFRHLDRALDSIGIATANRILLDLGLSSDQFETSGRGFSFNKNEPLLMTFAKTLTSLTPTGDSTLTARDIVNTWDEANIADIIYGYGEEKYARRIARGIAAARAEGPIETTFDLVSIIEKSTPTRYHHGRIHPATRTFQALRITVNDEVNALREGLVKAFERLAPEGRMAVISFHSIEDRIVKHFYKENAGQMRGQVKGQTLAEGQMIADDQPVAKILTKKPITPSDAEIAENPRSRSAKLRILEKS
jgi:16S rRNA (cytosine1402-N4)-methyltransferase